MHCGLWPSVRHAWSHWRRAPLGTREWSTVGRRRVGKKRIDFSVGIAWFGDILNIDDPLIEIGSRSVFTNSAVGCMQ